MRACQATSAKEMDEKAKKNLRDLLKDVSELRKALESDLAATMWSGDGNSQSSGLWLGQEEMAAATTAMKPKMATARKAVEALLFEVVALEVLHHSHCGCLELEGLHRMQALRAPCNRGRVMQ